MSKDGFEKSKFFATYIAALTAGLLTTGGIHIRRSGDRHEANEFARNLGTNTERHFVRKPI